MAAGAAFVVVLLTIFTLNETLSEEEKEKLKPIIEDSVEKEKFTVQFENMSENDRPIIITQSEFMRRMKEQQMSGGGNMFGGALPEMYNMVVNSNHALISELVNLDDNKQKETIGQLVDLALLSQNMLKGEAMSNFIKRSVELMKS